MFREEKSKICCVEILFAAKMQTREKFIHAEVGVMQETMREDFLEMVSELVLSNEEL